MQGAIAVLFTLLSSALFAAETFKAPLKVLPLDEAKLKEDLYQIGKVAKLPDFSLAFKFIDGPYGIELKCQDDRFILNVSAPEEEKASSVYKGLREMGFYFPHPMVQISPGLVELKKKCGLKTHWNPTLKYRGSHLHTLHPNEWVAGLYQSRPEIADAIVRWTARNNQNLLDLSLLRLSLKFISMELKPQYELAQGLQIHTGVSLGIALQQQKSYKLLSLFKSFIGWGDKEAITQGLNDLFKNIPLSFIVLEAGTSEFTPTSFEKTIRWLKTAGKVAEENGVQLFTKVHVSTNQVSEKLGNFNFLPQYTPSNVGILPHTVMFYGLLDEKAPMYGNKNFKVIKDFMLKQMGNRPTWYYPETSYWVGMDLDIPLFLTDYLVARAEDTKWLNQTGIEGQLNFTSGHALGGWLIDWNLALLADSDYKFSPLTALKLLGEDQEVWQKIIAYQTLWYKKKGLIALLSAANLQDELSSTHRIHERFTMKELSENPQELDREIKLLEESVKNLPDISKVKNFELKSLLKINQLRQTHALMIRQTLKNKDLKALYLKRAEEARLEAKGIVDRLSKLQTNYPKLPLFKLWKNPTSYQFGYVHLAHELYFWEREENQIRKDSYFPFFGNIIDVWRILF